jgi:hypothetical protein
MYHHFGFSYNNGIPFFMMCPLLTDICLAGLIAHYIWLWVTALRPYLLEPFNYYIINTILQYFWSNPNGFTGTGI